MSSKVFMIIGKSFSGKDTFLNNLLNDKTFCKLYNLHKLVRLTTRKPRPNEVDGKDYHFITDEEYLSYKDRDDVSITSFDSKFGKLHYITDFSILDPDKNYITVGDPESISRFSHVLGDNLCLIYLMPPNWEIFRRFGQRDDNTEYSDLKYKEIYRRFVDDTRKFGQRSNEFTANVNCIFILGTDVDFELFDIHVKMFIYGNWNENGVFLHNNDVPIPIKTTNKYPLFNMLSLDWALDGQIKLLNGKITVDTEKETVEFV